MKLEYAKHGRQFFFITLAVAERRAVLSRLVAGEKRPVLTALGALVAAALRAVHRVWPAAATSDYVIMPDHIHFLLIADYARDTAIAPLFIAHRLADAVEMAQAEEAERTGAAAPEPPSAPQTERAARRAQEERLAAEMARRIARAVEATAGVPLKVEAGLRFGEIKGGAEEAGGPRAATGAPGGGDGAAQLRGGAGAAAPVRSVIFARDCYIELSFDARQLKAIRHYIRLNPDRALWKARNPDLFLCHRAIRARRLAAFAPRRFDGIGALALLGSPFLFHVRLTLKKTVAEHATAIAEIVDKARHGWVPVSGFISPGEREALRRLKAEPRARFIKLLPCALPPRYDPSAEDSRELAAGRMLILSGFPETPHIPALDMKRHTAAARAFRQNCLALNDLAAALCAAGPLPVSSKKA